MYDTYQTKVADCGRRIKQVLDRLKAAAPEPAKPLSSPRNKRRGVNAPAFDVHKDLHAMLGVDLTQIHGLGPYLVLKLVAKGGTDLLARPNAKHFTSWLSLAPHKMIPGGKVLASRTRRSGNRAASLLRLAAITVGRTEAALGGLPTTRNVTISAF
ncbi:MULTISPECIES: transposase [unclassified Azospirillum]|uniref:transposase n=1 Tax=unclassified Azospirillum TaxID=2630922 RepID=UPI001304BFB6|nr:MULTISPECIES: transposase [unclassified Azospirillum]